jgi:hypothetical protein
MAFFTKKPVTIEARQFDGSASSAAAIVRWVVLCDHQAQFADDKLTIETLEGTHLANPGDWIIKGVAGEFYPCKPDIFEKTYEPS